MTDGEEYDKNTIIFSKETGSILDGISAYLYSISASIIFDSL